ncbi:MAG: hypothetical protein ACD_57C00027G0002 [uncultured bacterium]|uniref:N-end rule aminoacyl transferase C-terminal domain-containing protein n=1 Tax=Candidatus Woesebacteria bacterium RIFCSPLOWO2_01_FULL_39_21 TaxID=1802519 RepID=A0A1F8BDE3_9BACT|nr:MAG: hypothetical protein ACD_57C00027G0002 [uncultured bacterium]OGM22525.1 MAG: hypothetical protein A2691_04645 [Candidatus Woesebacteria bacterium RIFCSPHIGHO2_01_FULL_39_23]OGM61970.1 MAG: hypothetical protein A2961_02810 [Candidatus Woesebacteria bacterium RIFCSPLOWO2_01_FULL_39_21]
MKYFYSEAKVDYSKYLFPYQVYLIKEDNDEVGHIYAKGFLPVRSIKDLYYLARSSRVNLKNFELSSENRRVIGKISNLYFEVKDMGQFQPKHRDFKLARKFVKDRFWGATLSSVGLKKIFSDLGNYNKVAVFAEKGKLMGFAALNATQEFVHYAHAFYDVGYREKSLGMGMMTMVVDWAKNSRREYTYLGTCYGEKSLYKTQFKGFEFFDGVSWSADLAKLKYLNSKDYGKNARHILQDREFLKKYYDFPSLTRLVKKLKYDF